jgi:thiol-disulfide isomerase/thioredoxin
MMRKGGKRTLRVLTSVFIVVVATAAPADSPALGPARKAATFSMHSAPRPMPPLVFSGGDGRTVRLKDFRGKVIVLNLWATWCAPCRKEMPSLDRLQSRSGGKDFEVVALSVDFAGLQAVRKFYQDFGINHLRLFVDPSSQVLDQVKVLGLPATLLIDRDGREIGRLVGAAEWDSPEMLRLFRGLIGQGRKDRTVQTIDSLSTARAD